MEKTARGSVPVQEGCCPVRAEHKKKRKAAEKNGHDQEGGKLFDPETAQKKKARQNRTKAEKY